MTILNYDESKAYLESAGIDGAASLAGYLTRDGAKTSDVQCDAAIAKRREADGKRLAKAARKVVRIESIAPAGIDQQDWDDDNDNFLRNPKRVKETKMQSTTSQVIRRYGHADPMSSLSLSTQSARGMASTGSRRNSRDYLRPDASQSLNHTCETILLAADRDGWRDGITVTV